MRLPRAAVLLLGTFVLSIPLAAPRASAVADDKPAAEAKQPPRTDLYGDPLPAGAIARLGSVRLRLGECRQILFSADSKELISVGADGVIRFWDTEDGGELRKLAVKGRGFTAAAVSADGKTLAAVAGDWVYLWDAKTYEQRAAVEVKGMGALCLAFSPNGKTLASAGKDKIIRLWDVESGKERRTLEGHEWPIVSLEFCPDSRLLGARDEGEDPVPPARPQDRKHYVDFRMWDVASGVTRWQTDNIGDFHFLPSGDLVALSNGLRVLNAKDGSEVRAIPIGRVWPEAPFIVTPDGKELVTTGDVPDRDGIPTRRNSIVVWSLNGKTPPEFLDGQYSRFYLAAMSPDGKILATGGTLWDWKARRRKGIVPGPAGSLFFLPDGKTIMSGGSDGVIRFWDAATGRLLRRLGDDKERLPLLAASPDCAKLAALRMKQDGPTDTANTVNQHREERPIVHLVDSATGKDVSVLEGSAVILHTGPPDFPLDHVAFSPDGKMIALGGEKGLRLWDASSGKELPVPEKLHGLYVHQFAFSPEGSLLAVQEYRRIHLWDLREDKERQVFTMDREQAPDGARRLAFTPDGRLLACSQSNQVCGWDTMTGKQVRRMDGNRLFSGLAIAFSPNAQLLATASTVDDDDSNRPLRGLNPHHVIRVYDTATYQEVAQFDYQRAQSGFFTFAHDGKHLAASYYDGTALVWDVRGDASTAQEPSDLGVDSLKSLWNDLAATDTAVAYAASCALANCPKQSEEFIAPHLAKAPPRDAGAIRRLIADLDANDFETREAASRKLVEFGVLARPELKEAAASPSAEMQRRARALLQAMDQSVPAPERLREIGAIRALERIGTPEARRLLETLAEGESLAPLTQDAMAALQRLRRKETQP